MRPAALILLASSLLAAQPVTKLEGFKDVFRHGDTFVSGQPTLELLRELRRQGVRLVVNVRDEKEVKDHAAIAFSEEALVRELGMAYLSLPLGDRASYTPAVVDRLKEALAAHPGPALLHCTVGGRATVLYMAHLVRNRGLKVDDATAVGRQMKFSLSLEDLLGRPLSLQLP